MLRQVSSINHFPSHWCTTNMTGPTEHTEVDLPLILSCPFPRVLSHKILKIWVEASKPRGGGGGVLGSIFAGYVLLAPPDPYPIIVYSVANYRPHVSHFWANIPQIPTCRKLVNPEIPQMCDPILVTLLAPNENATPL